MNDCDTCAYCSYDEELDCYSCEMNLDEDEYARFVQGQYKKCPYYRDGNEYKIARMLSIAPFSIDSSNFFLKKS